MGLNQGVLFVCSHNSARSQMAEGFARFLGPAAIAVYSAGSAPTTINPYAVAVMKEVGIDISEQRSKGLDDVPLERIALVVTLCDAEVCPVVPGIQRLHRPLPDPAADPALDPLPAFRRARDQVRELISALF